MVWLKKYLVELTNYLLNPDDRKHPFSLDQMVGICQEVTRIQKRIEYLSSFPEWALKFEFNEGEAFQVPSGSNTNRQGQPLRTLRKIPKVTRTWTTFH